MHYFLKRSLHVTVCSPIPRLNRVHKIANQILALGYLGLVCKIAWTTVSHQASLMGGAILVLLLLTLAIGHFLLKSWALMTSAAISSLVSLLYIPYLFSSFEPELSPPMQTRAVYFLLIAVFTAAMVANYLICKKSK
jgi:hypothetical protein